MIRPIVQYFTSRKLFTSTLTIMCLLVAVMLVKGWQPGKMAAAHATGSPLLAPIPMLDLNVQGMEFPNMGLIGEKFCYTARITNAGSNPATDVGYNPYIQLILPPDITIDNPNTDVGLAGVCSGPSCTPSSSYPISLPTPFTCTTTGGCTTTDPYGVPITVPFNYTLWIIQPPIGSLYPGEPGIDVQICLKVSDNATIGSLLSVCHKPVFQYGPSFSAPVQGTQDCRDVMAAVIKLTKRALNYTSNKIAPNPTVEMPTGSCNPITYELIANIAATKTVTGIIIQDQLPSGMTLVNGSVTVLNALSPLNVSTACTNYGGNFVCAVITQEQGAPGTPPNDFEPRDLVVQFQAYVNDNVLSPSTCGSTIISNLATLDADYLGEPVPQQTSQLLIEVEHVTLQKTANGLPFDPTDPLHVIPGQTVEYNLNFQVSGNINLDANTTIVDRLPNGISYQAGSATLSCGGAPIVIVPSIGAPASDGSVQLTFAPGARPSCSKCTIRYLGTVQQTYNAPLAGQPVLASDPLILSCGSPSSPLKCTTINYNIVGGASGCSDDTAGGVIIKPVQIEKSLVTPEPPGGFTPGSHVTFKLKMCIPSGDAKNIELTDYLPAPVLGFYNLIAPTLTQSPNVGATLTWTSSTADNSIKFNINPSVITTNPTQTVCFEIQFTALVTSLPFADDLYLTNLVQSKNTTTDGSTESHLTGVAVHVRAPKIKLTKGVFSSDNPNATIAPPPTTTPVNGNISGADASDKITFYITATNVGGATAFSTTITDIVPAGMMYVPGSLMQVSSLSSVTLNDTAAPNLSAVVFVMLPGESFIIKFTAMLPSDASPCQTITNTASAIWKSSIGTPDFSAVSDSATVSTAQPTISKTIVSTNQPHTTGNNVAIGEKVKYLVHIRVPEGKFNNVVLMDTLPSGLAVADVAVVPTKSSPITTSNPFACAISPPPGANGGGLITCNLGMVTNSDTNNAADEFIEFMYEAVVLNVPGNVQGTMLSNTVKWTSTECANVTLTSTPVKVVEPKLQIAKTPSVMTADAGDVITWTITVTNNSPSDADAFQVKVSDLIPTIQGQSYVAGSLMTVGGLAPTSLNPPVGSQPLTVNWNSFPLGATSTIKFQTLVGSSVGPCSTLTNSATVNWASIPATTTPISPWNTSSSCPRMGSPALCGSPNNYTATSTATVSVPGFTVQKNLTATSAQNTTGSNVTIGEILTYQLNICVPEGASSGIVVTDALPPGLEAVSATLLPGIAGTGGPLTITPGCGATQTFNLSSFSIPGDNNPANNCFTIELKARVCDVASNSGMPGMQTVLNNSFTAFIPGDEPGLPPVCASTSNQVPVTVVEPKLDVKKSFSPTVVQPGGTVQITVTVTNIGTSEAYGLALVDVLGSCLQFLNATVPPGYTAANGAGTLTITGSGSNPLLVGAANALTFVITAQVGECCFVPNTITASATTLPDVQTGERPETGSGSASLIVKGNNCPCFTVPLSFNMDAWWPFDEKTGTVANDLSGLVNNVGSYGPGSAKPSPTPGVVKGALSFDGVDDYLEAGPGGDAEINFPGSCNTPGNKAFTIDAWIKTNQGQTTTTILDKRVEGTSAPIGYSMFLYAGRPGFQIGDGTVYGNFIAPSSIADDNWHFVAIVMDRCNPNSPGQGRIYVDGLQVYTFTLFNGATPISGFINNSAKLQIGRHMYAGSTYYSQFAIDELEFFKRALSNTELDQIYQAGAGGKCKMSSCPTPSFAQPLVRDAHSRPVSLAVADFELDGKLDLAVGNQSSGDVSILSGSNAYVPPTNYSLSVGIDVNRLVAGLFNSNADSRPDIAVTVASGGPQDVVKTLSSPGYTVTGNNPMPNDQPFGIATGQFNVTGAGSDSFADLAVADFSGNRVVTLKGNGNGGFTPDQSIILPGGNGPTGIVVGRFNTDAFDDLAVAASNTGKIYILIGNGDGTFNNFTSFASGNSGDKPFLMTLADIDGSGGIDLAVVNKGGNNVAVFLGDGSGGFSPAGFGPFPVGSSPHAVAAGDINCDGKTDLVVANSSSNFVSVLLGVGNGDFGSATNFNVSGGQFDVALADLNGDGRLDIAVAIPQPGNVSILYNTCPCGGCKLPAITVEPVGQKVCVNDTANFNAVAVGNLPLTIQWESSTDNGVTWTPISGATSNTYSTGESGKLFHAVFTNSCGTATSDAVSVTIDQTCVKICPDCDPNTNNLRTGCCSTFNSSLIIQAPADVQWEFRSNRGWIIPTGRTGGGMGNGTVNFTIPPNPLTTPRTGMISFAGSQYNVTQDGAVTARTTRLVGPGGSVSPGSTFNVPIEVVAQGNEHSLFFSLSFNPNILGNPQVVLGSGAAGATLDSDSISVPSRLGVTLLLPPGQTLAAGTRQVAVASFTVAANPGTSSTVLDFDDQPTPRLIQDVNFGVLPSNFTGTTITPGCNLAISPPVLPNGTTNTSYSQTLTASGGTGPYSFARIGGLLPPGLTLATNGALTGTPTTAGAFNFTVEATDSTGCTGTKLYSLTINQGCVGVTIIVNPATLANGFVGTLYNQTINATPAGSYTWSTSTGALPAGLTLNPTTGAITGLPTIAGTSTFTVRATGTNNCFGERGYTVTISGSGLQFYTLPTPVRIVDTRVGQAACSTPGAPIAGGTSMTQAAAGFCGIPSVARAIMGNVTLVLPPINGFVSIFPSNTTPPTAANSNFIAGDVLNNVFTVGLGPADGAFKIFASTTVDVVVDVTGYFAPPAAGGLFLHMLPTPIRLEDTRVGQSACVTPGAPLPGGADTIHQGTTTCGGATIPSTARAIMGNVTVVFPVSNGFITAFPADVIRPPVASGNYKAGSVLNSPFTTGLSPTGQFKLFSSATTDAVIDVLGYFSSDPVDINGTGLLFTPITPARLVDTRPGQPACFNLGAPLSGGVEQLQAAANTCTIASTARAVLGNVTVVLPPANGFLTFWPSNTPRPAISTSNFTAGRNFNRFFTVALGPADGAFKMFTSTSTNAVIDVSGYYAP